MSNVSTHRFDTHRQVCCTCGRTAKDIVNDNSKCTATGMRPRNLVNLAIIASKR